MTKEKKMRLFKKVKEKLEGIDNAETLKRNGLQLVDLEMLYKVLPAVFNSPDGKTYCLSGNVADWCRKAGLKVIEPNGKNSYTSVNYTICLE